MAKYPPIGTTTVAPVAVATVVPLTATTGTVPRFRDLTAKPAVLTTGPVGTAGIRGSHRADRGIVAPPSRRLARRNRAAGLGTGHGNASFASQLVTRALCCSGPGAGPEVSKPPPDRLLPQAATSPRAGLLLTHPGISLCTPMFTGVHSWEWQLYRQGK